MKFSCEKYLLQTDQHTGIVVRDITSNINSSERE